MNSSPTVVIYKLGSLGDMVMALPFFHRVANLHPRSRKILVTNKPVAAIAPPAAAILAGSGLVDDFISYEVGTRSPLKLLRLGARIAGLHARALYYLHECSDPVKARRDRAFFRLCGIADVVGAPTELELCRYRVDPASGWREAECEKLARSLAAIGPIDLAARSNWDLRLTVEERAAGSAALADLGANPAIAINMGGKVAQNDWGHDNWTKLIGRLGQRYEGFGMFAVGAAQDEKRASEIGQLWRGNFANLCGRLTPRQSAAALEHAMLFIGHDSGPIHLAAAMGVPCVGLYGNFNPPRTWHPYFGQHRIIHEMRGIARIEVGEVEKAVDAFLNERFRRAAV